MLRTGITPNFIVVDGAAGGTGAAPLEFCDHVGVLQEGLLLVRNTLVGVNLRSRVSIGAAGKVTSAFDIVRLLALGANWCNAGRGFMMVLGCIQAQTCHTGHCPTGVTAQNPLRQQALMVPDKAELVRSFHRSTLHALQELMQAAGLKHPNEVNAHHEASERSQRPPHRAAPDRHRSPTAQQPDHAGRTRRAAGAAGRSAQCVSPLLANGRRAQFSDQQPGCQSRRPGGAGNCQGKSCNSVCGERLAGVSTRWVEDAEKADIEGA